VVYLCPACEKRNTPESPPRGVLKTVYDYQAIRKATSSFQELSHTGFIDLLPIRNRASLPYLRVGGTPLYAIPTLNGKALKYDVFLKDDSQNPTFSFKDRASAVVSAFARENGMNTIVAASTGNAGSSLAGICASQGQRAIVMVPETAPVAKLTQIVMYGATIVPVKGTYDVAFDLSIKATQTYGWYNRNTAFNPLTIEGKKTVAFELLEQLNFDVPDRIFVPVGDGVIISGVYKGFEDMLMLGYINTMPTIVAVQSEGSNNLVRNLDSKTFTIKPSSTIADSISVDIPRNFFMAQHFIRNYGGEALTVSDGDILAASAILSRSTGIFSEPAAATAFAGMLSYDKNGRIANRTKNVVLLTGSGLKDLKSVSGLLRVPKPIAPTLNDLQNYFNDNIHP